MIADPKRKPHQDDGDSDKPRNAESPTDLLLRLLPSDGHLE